MADKNFMPKGPYAAMVTPYNEDGTINEPMLRQYVEFLSESGIAGLFPCGSTGEFIHLSMEDNCSIMDMAADQTKGRLPVVPGVCTSSLESTLKLARHAESIGCPAVVICPPYYISLGQKEILHYFRTIARNIGTKVILYNIPQFTNEITMDTLQELIQEPNIVGIKDSSGNLKKIIHYIRLAQELRPDFRVMTGSDDIIYPALAAGCVGSMTALSGLIPEVNAMIYKAYYDEDHKQAVKLQHSVLKLISLAEKLAFPAGYKLIAEIRGFAMGPSKQIVIPAAGTKEYSELADSIRTELEKLLGSNVKAV